MPHRVRAPRLTCLVLAAFLFTLTGCENDIEANSGPSGIEVGTHAAGPEHVPAAEPAHSGAPAATTQPATKETTAPAGH